MSHDACQNARQICTIHRLGLSMPFWKMQEFFSRTLKIKWNLHFFLWRAPQMTLRTHHSLRLFVQPCDDEDEQFFYQFFTINGAPVDWNRQGKTDNSEKNLSQWHFVHHKSHMDLTWDRTLGLRGERPATNLLSHGTAQLRRLQKRNKVTVFWDVTPCGSVRSYRRFGENYWAVLSKTCDIWISSFII